jgi:hypothetical protein
MNTDTPLPPDEPTAPNPPEGAIIDYYLPSTASSTVTLEIAGSDGKLVRRYTSDDRVFTPDPATLTVPPYWYRPLSPLSKEAGMHRFTWDMHYQPLDQLTGPGRQGGPNLPIAAIAHNTVPNPTTPWVNPGTFTVKLTVDGRTETRSLRVRLDPRVKTPPLAMQQIYTLSKAMYYGAIDAQAAEQQAKALRDQIARVKPQASGAAADALAALDRKLEGIAGASAGLARTMTILTGADVRPTALQLEMVARARAAGNRAVAQWTALKTVDVPAVNRRLSAGGLSPLTP